MLIRAEKRAYLNRKFQFYSSKEKLAEFRKLNILKNKNTLIPDHLKNVNDLNELFTQISQNNIISKAELLNFYRNTVFPDDTFHLTQTEKSVSKIILNIKTKAFGTDKLLY